ncbi:MAG TPA: SpoIIE family protein phosphatase [Candidatus Limnocylindrales bacterium]|nr:SpoIIE family protein phosphatase [Candidatus Limnocylindrales bacterium]
MAQVTEPYLREQLEKRRDELKQAIASPAVHVAQAPFVHLLQEVDAALERMDEGTFGICEACHDTIEKERLIADPLVRLCLDHLSSEEQRALEGDLELAAKIQRGLLPQTDLRFRGWHLHYEYRPAGVVSGDYCDVISAAGADGELTFLLGDVAGKGVAASMLMTHLHAMFRSLSAIGISLDKLLELGNRIFCESTIAGQYATLVCGRTTKTGGLEIASAGHLPILRVSKNEVQQLNATGLPLGMFSSSHYGVRRLQLEPGDSLLLYTDGISEARDGGGSEYGVDRLAVIAGEQHGRAPGEMVQACLEDVRAFALGAKQADDQTVLAIHRTDSAGILSAE